MNMANANSYMSEAIIVKLTGYDIPGVTLRAPFEGHAVLAIKRCLLCQGINASTSCKKPKLVTKH